MISPTFTPLMSQSTTLNEPSSKAGLPDRLKTCFVALVFAVAPPVVLAAVALSDIMFPPRIGPEVPARRLSPGQVHRRDAIDVRFPVSTAAPGPQQ